MNLLLTCFILGLLPIPAALALESDVVNERIPVARRDLERHWQVDCGAVIQRHNTAAVHGFAKLTGDELAALIRDATLCSYIHNPPGESLETCPDYRGIVADLSMRMQKRETGAADTGAGRIVDCRR